MAVPSELLDVIDQRILRYLQAPIALGTCSSRDSTGSRAMVVFDGDVSPVPVKVLGTAEVQPPDRVLMVRALGSGAAAPISDDTRKRAPGEWIVLGGFTQRRGSGTRVSTRGVFSPTGPGNPTGTFSDIGEIASLAITKRYDNTRLNVGHAMNMLINGANTRAEVGARIGGTDYSLYLVHATISQHIGGMGARDIAGIPAGDYVVQARWRIDGGAGTVGANNGDAYSFWVEEVGP